MLKNLSVLAIVPARGGSKRIIGKNKRPLAGSPLISWTLRACFGCNYIDEVIVSTDDFEIEEIARTEGVSQIHRRPLHLASDTSPTLDTVIEIIQELEADKRHFDLIALAQPTSPLRTSAHISAALELLSDSYPASVVGVTESPHPKEWQGSIGKNGDMSSFLLDTRLDLPSHSLPASYIINGAVYIAPRETLLKDKTFFSPSKLIAFFMSRRDSIDIDTDFDFEIAEYLMLTRSTLSETPSGAP